MLIILWDVAIKRITRTLACKVVRHKRFSGDETYILTLLDIVAMKSSPKIQLIAFHILSNEYKDAIGVDVCIIILRKMETIFGLSPSDVG